jgi:hypothetical protein
MKARLGADCSFSDQKLVLVQAVAEYLHLASACRLATLCHLGHRPTSCFNLVVCLHGSIIRIRGRKRVCSRPITPSRSHCTFGEAPASRNFQHRSMHGLAEWCIGVGQGRQPLGALAAWRTKSSCIPVLCTRTSQPRTAAWSVETCDAAMLSPRAEGDGSRRDMESVEAILVPCPIPPPGRRAGSFAPAASRCWCLGWCSRTLHWLTTFDSCLVARHKESSP